MQKESHGIFSYKTLAVFLRFSSTDKLFHLSIEKRY